MRQSLNNDDYRKLVAAGYDEIAETYLSLYGVSSIRDRKLAELKNGLSPGARVLDLGCGAGLPAARDLAAHDFKVTGVDVSARQIERAQNNVPNAIFMHADMTRVEFPPASFEAIGAFYSITHVPRDEHFMLLQHISRWLAPGGRFVGSFGASPLESWTGEWLGTKMFFSHHDIKTTKQLVSKAGLSITKAELVRQDNEDAWFLWITAHKP
jgi:cyclopropane fatty-acyl-phospholipid synthase-like methyltransferase